VGKGDKLRAVGQGSASRAGPGRVPCGSRAGPGRVPGGDASGKRTTSLVELVGVYPTLCELAGLPKPEHLQGSSFAALFDDPNVALRKTAFSQYSREGATRHSVRTQCFRYTEWRDLKTDDLRHGELHDHRKNSREEHNLADEVRYAKQVERLSSLLHRGSREGIYE